MKLTDKQIQRMVHLIVEELKTQNIITFKVKEENVLQRASEVVQKNMADERALDNEVNKMMDELERQHSGEFQRYKMFPLLKKKLAKEKGFVL